jgi:pimeloyl-ACP methyl ester carboxylesterase
LQEQHRATDWKIVLQKTREMLTGLGTNKLLNATVLAQIDHHVRIGIGDRDTMVSIEESLNAYRALKNAEFQVFANTPHPFDRVAPRLIADAPTQFLRP